MGELVVAPLSAWSTAGVLVMVPRFMNTKLPFG